jgi:hypothetical protein
MRSNLSYLSLVGVLEDQFALGPEHQRNSIRHLAVSDDGDVAFAMQWQGDLTVDLPLLVAHRREAGKTELFEETSVRKMQGYLGSVAFNSGTDQIATTSPRSGVLQVFGARGQVSETALADVCGVSVAPGGFVVTTGTGSVRTEHYETNYGMAWDNHLIAI